MTDKRADDLMGTVRPHTVDDDRVVPGPGVYNGNHGDTDQGVTDTSANRVPSDKDHRGERDDEEHAKKLKVGHRQRRGVARVTGRMARGYQRGVVAAVPAAVLASLFAAVRGLPSPMEATAEELMQWTPVPAAEFLLTHLGTLARPAALLGALAFVMLAGGLSGGGQALLGCGLFRETAGYLLAAVLMSGIFLIAIPPSTPAPEWALILLFIPCLALTRLRGARISGRREFLERSGIIFGGAALLVSLFSVEPVLSALATRRLFYFRSPRGLAVSGVSELVTPTGRFYVMDKVLEVPRFGPLGWRLAVEGMVRTPLALDFGALLSQPHTSKFVTCECVDNAVGGSLMSTALWTGVPVAGILKKAGAFGQHVIFHGADNYSESTPIAELSAADALIAFAMNGETLRREHGYPARLLLPGVYGFKSVKWVTEMEVVAHAYAGTWHAHGWTDTAIVQTTTRIDVARREGDRLLLAGIAFAGRRGVRAVEVRVNGGPWRRATLGPRLARETWIQWAIVMKGQSRARIEARAIDGTGRIQSGKRVGAYPNGSSGWATAEV